LPWGQRTELRHDVSDPGREPGSADGHRERDWSLFSVARDGHMRRLEYRTSVGIVYSQVVKDHNALHAAD
jgi:hypothetical protein